MILILFCVEISLPISFPFFFVVFFWGGSCFVEMDFIEAIGSGLIDLETPAEIWITIIALHGAHWVEVYAQSANTKHKYLFFFAHTHTHTRARTKQKKKKGW